MKHAHLLAGAVVACASFAAYRLASPPKETNPSSSSVRAHTASRPNAAPARGALGREARVATADVVEAVPELAQLRAGLEAPSVGERIAAIDTAREQGLTAALPELQRIAIEQDAWVGRAAIGAIGSIARLATPVEAAAAAERLSFWLDSERRRVDADPAAPGNVVQLVEALGQVPAPAASTALRRLLSDAEQPRYLQVLAARQLENARDPAAAHELRDFEARAQRWVAADDGEREEVAQALAAAAAALAAIER